MRSEMMMGTRSPRVARSVNMLATVPIAMTRVSPFASMQESAGICRHASFTIRLISLRRLILPDMLPPTVSVIPRVWTRSSRLYSIVGSAIMRMVTLCPRLTRRLARIDMTRSVPPPLMDMVVKIMFIS